MVSVDTLLMHPHMARVEGWDWNCPGRVRGREGYRIGAHRGAPGTYTEQLTRWMERRGVRVFEEGRGLLDTKGQRVWRVDFVCEMGGRCTLVTLSCSPRRVWTGSELAYAQRLKHLARATYGADVRVVAIKVYAKGRITSREITDPMDFSDFIPEAAVLKPPTAPGTADEQT
jgi:hypothetical protein